MLKRARALAERAGICSSRSSREFSSGGGVRIVGKHAFDTKGKVLVLGVTSRQRCTFSKEGSEYLLSLDALSNASDRRSRAVLIGKSANGKHRSLISLQFPWCNATGLFQLLDMFESQVIIGGVEYRWIYSGGAVFSSTFTCTFVRMDAPNEAIAKFQVRASGFCLKDVTFKVYKPVDTTVFYAMLFGAALQIRGARYEGYKRALQTHFDDSLGNWWAQAP